MEVHTLRRIMQNYGAFGIVFVACCLLLYSFRRRPQRLMMAGSLLAGCMWMLETTCNVRIVFGSSFPQQAAEIQMYKIIDLGVLPNCENNSPQVLNAQTQVAGRCYFANDRNLSYLWEQGHLRPLGTLGGTECDAFDLNDNGQVVGVSRTVQGEKRAFLWQKDTISDLGTLGGSDSLAISLNNKGQIVGSADTSANKSRPVLWDQEGIHDLSALLPPNSGFQRINDREQILGRTMTRSGYDSFLLDHKKVIRIQTAKGNYCLANALNEQGEVVGLCRIDRNLRAFLWKRGSLLDLGTLGGASSSARSINNNAKVVGVADTSNVESHAFLWQAGHMQDLNALVPQGSEWVLERAVSINDRDEIIGTGSHAGKPAAFLLLPVK